MTPSCPSRSAFNLSKQGNKGLEADQAENDDIVRETTRLFQYVAVCNIVWNSGLEEMLWEFLIVTKRLCTLPVV